MFSEAVEKIKERQTAGGKLSEKGKKNSGKR